MRVRSSVGRVIFAEVFMTYKPKPNPSVPTMLSFLWMALHVFCGLFGNYLYRTSVLHRCRRLKRNFPSDYEARLPIEGGITVALFALAFFVVEFFPQILCNLLLYFHM